MPSVNLGHKRKAATAAPAGSAHRQTYQRRRKVLKEDESDEEVKWVQTELRSETIRDMEEDVDRLTEDIAVLKDDVAALTLNEAFFQEDDHRVAFYTGLPSFLVLKHLVSFVSPFLRATGGLSQFQQVVATLMRCRLNLEERDLAYRFCVSAPTVAACFRTVVEVLHVRMGPLVRWPPRAELLKSAPVCFQEGFPGSAAVILDCLEVLIHRPENLMARIQTWSPQNRCHTVKVLTGATPHGLILFLTPAWRGRVSLRYMAENCGIMENLLPGDMVLTGPGLDSAGSVGVFRTEVTPQGRKQLTASEGSDSSQLLDISLYLQEVTGRVQEEYTILKGPVDLDFLTRVGPEKQPLIDKVAAVCCALINLSPAVVV